MITEAIIIAFITGGMAVVSNVIVAVANNSKTIYRIDQLEKKVEKHNNLVERVYEAEKKIAVHEDKIKSANHRLDDLEEIKHV